MDRKQYKDLFLFFDGATADGNPGRGGCGAICYDTDAVDKEPVFRESRTLGPVTSNVAEYYALITGLRRVLYEFPITEFDLVVRGDSELVINQMTGRYELRSENLYPLYLIAKGLTEKIKGKVSFEHILRNENKATDKLAKHASKAQRLPLGHFLVFYPSRMGLYEATMNGKQLVVGNDDGAAARTPEVLFDARTVLEILGEDALKSLIDPGKTSRVNGMVQFTVLGILRKPVTLTVFSNNGPIILTIDDVVVVDSLPYDAQISVKHPQVKDAEWGLGNGKLSFEAKSVPGRFRSHPYWHNNSLFIATGYGLRGG